MALRPVESLCISVSAWGDGSQLMETQPSRFRRTTNLNGRNPVSHTLLVTFAIHDAGIATAPKKGIAGVFVGCLAEVGYLFARGDVVSPDQGMEEGHRRECRGMEMGGDSPVVALLESLASVNSALREAFACLQETAEKVWRGLNGTKLARAHATRRQAPVLIPRDQDLPPPGCNSLDLRLIGQ